DHPCAPHTHPAPRTPAYHIAPDPQLCQESQNNQISSTDMQTTSVSSGISTISGQQIVSLQLVSQSGIPFDEIILGDLAADFARSLDSQVITGSGSAGQLRGLENGAAVGT